MTSPVFGIFVLLKISSNKWHIFRFEAAAFQVIQYPRVGGEIEGQFIRIQGLPRLVIAAVHLSPAVFAVT